MKKRSVYALSMIMVLLLPFFVGGVVRIGTAVAHGQGFLGVFGGMILWVQPCTCDGSWIIEVGPPRDATVHYYPGISKLYAYGQILKIGAWVLGIYGPPTPCMNWFCSCGRRGCTCWCAPVVYPDGNILIVGTSH